MVSALGDSCISFPSRILRLKRVSLFFEASQLPELELSAILRKNGVRFLVDGVVDDGSGVRVAERNVEEDTRGLRAIAPAGVEQPAVVEGRVAAVEQRRARV
eukprot:874946-Pleurochrysis_carterae.AAC.5